MRTNEIGTSGTVALRQRLGEKRVARLEVASLRNVMIGAIVWVALCSDHLHTP